MTTAVAREVKAWRLVAHDLGIAFEAPFVLEREGSRYEYLGRLPQFGAPRGMLVMLAYDPAAADAASASGFGFSCVELGEQLDRESVVEMLKDWTWNGTGGILPAWWREV